MTTFGFRTLGWIAFVGLAAPGFYLVTSQVAAERARVESVERAIVKARGDIRQLETEFDTRANMAQLERWNGDVLALAAPHARQFIGGAAQLAALSGRAIESDATLAYVVPSAPAELVQVAAAADAPAPAAAAPARTAETVATVAKAPVGPAPGTTVRAVAQSVRTAAVQPAAKAPRVAMLDRSLLTENTLGDLARGARKEAVAHR